MNNTSLPHCRTRPSERKAKKQGTNRDKRVKAAAIAAFVPLNTTDIQRSIHLLPPYQTSLDVLSSEREEVSSQ
jgi:hypothetical protein